MSLLLSVVCVHQANAGRLTSKHSPVKKIYVSEGAKIKDLAYEGDPKYQYQLGNLYYTGHQRIGIKQSFEKAFEWYQKAATQGHANAMHNLGFLYLKGYGVDEDFYLAFAWFKLAIKYGSSTAEKTWKSLSSTYSELDQEELSEIDSAMVTLEQSIEKKHRKN